MSYDTPCPHGCGTMLDAEGYERSAEDGGPIDHAHTCRDFLAAALKEVTTVGYTASLRKRVEELRGGRDHDALVIAEMDRKLTKLGAAVAVARQLGKPGGTDWPDLDAALALLDEPTGEAIEKPAPGGWEGPVPETIVHVCQDGRMRKYIPVDGVELAEMLDAARLDTATQLKVAHSDSIHALQASYESARVAGQGMADQRDALRAQLVDRDATIEKLEIAIAHALDRFEQENLHHVAEEMRAALPTSTLVQIGRVPVTEEDQP